MYTSLSDIVWFRRRCMAAAKPPVAKAGYSLAIRAETAYGEPRNASLRAPRCSAVRPLLQLDNHSTAFSSQCNERDNAATAHAQVKSPSTCLLASLSRESSSSFT